MPSWLKQIISYVVSFVVYSWMLTPKVALVLLGAIAFHEGGHLYAAKLMGLKTKGFYLIPGLGGAALIAERYQRYSQMAFVLLAGPIAGWLLALIFFGLYLLTGSYFIGVSAYWMAFLNLFNLLPIALLDGGQLVESIVYSINDTLGTWFITISYIIGAFIIWQFNPLISGMIIFFGVGNILTAWKSLKLRKQGMGKYLSPQPIKMSRKEISQTIAVYIGTALGLLSIVYLCVNNYLHIVDFFHG